MGPTSDSKVAASTSTSPEVSMLCLPRVCTASVVDLTPKAAFRVVYSEIVGPAPQSETSAAASVPPPSSAFVRGSKVLVLSCEPLDAVVAGTPMSYPIWSMFRAPPALPPDLCAVSLACYLRALVALHERVGPFRCRNATVLILNGGEEHSRAAYEVCRILRVGSVLVHTRSGAEFAHVSSWAPLSLPQKEVEAFRNSEKAGIASPAFASDGGVVPHTPLFHLLPPSSRKDFVRSILRATDGLGVDIILDLSDSSEALGMPFGHLRTSLKNTWSPLLRRQQQQQVVSAEGEEKSLESEEASGNGGIYDFVGDAILKEALASVSPSFSSSSFDECHFGFLPFQLTDSTTTTATATSTLSNSAAALYNSSASAVSRNNSWQAGEASSAMLAASTSSFTSSTSAAASMTTTLSPTLIPSVDEVTLDQLLRCISPHGHFVTVRSDLEVDADSAHQLRERGASLHLQADSVWVKAPYRTGSLHALVGEILESLASGELPLLASRSAAISSSAEAAAGIPSSKLLDRVGGINADGSPPAESDEGGDNAVESFATSRPTASVVNRGNIGGAINSSHLNSSARVRSAVLTKTAIEIIANTLTQCIPGIALVNPLLGTGYSFNSITEEEEKEEAAEKASAETVHSGSTEFASSRPSPMTRFDGGIVVCRIR